MGKVNWGIGDGFNNKVGTVVGYTIRGKRFMRAYNGKVKNPRTEAQQLVRARFKVLSALRNAMSEAINKGLAKMAAAKRYRPVDAFMHLNWDKVSAETPETAVVALDELVLSQGSLKGVDFGQPDFSERGTVTVSYESIAEAYAGDLVYIFVYQADLNEGVLSVASTRQAGSATVAVPRSWSGMRAHVYGFAVGNSSANNGIPSATTYIGSGNLS